VTPERWQEIKHLLATAMELPPAERPAYLDRGCAGDASLRHDVESLLAGEDQLGAHFLDGMDLAAVATEVLPEDESPWVGRRVGPYKTVEQIGSGGMGEVYRAVRADEQYRKEVALKVIRAGQDSAAVVARFKNERQILAGLDHPNIARLLDGGTTAEGTPYFVMELIAGQPITDYCDGLKFSIAGRLKLFAQVCSAVQYAHQRLIIHRDIKPGNILVTAAGVPKLLDFGIAKIVAVDPSVDSPEATMTAFRLLTPGYASPEQIMGEPMTVATDVYSLGVVLYELLTGHSPYRVPTGSSQEVAQAACYKEPQKPSTAVFRPESLSKETGPLDLANLAALRDSSPDRLRKRLSGDLDNIILMALRKEPSRRYASVEQFAEDISRHLENQPVTARKDTVRYRASKFVRRHKAGAVAFAVATIAILAGLAVTLREARVARQQAEIARVQRARAERRFNDVRKLANSLMFEIHDSIRDLPGTIVARKLLVSRAQEYLDSLSQDAVGDQALQRELAAAYDRVGDLTGYTGAANLGDFTGALRSYNKALAIRESDAAALPNDIQVQSDLMNNYFHLTFALIDSGDFDEALKDAKKGIPISEKLAAEHPEPKFQDWLAGFHWILGNVFRHSGDFPHALEQYRISTAIREPIARAPAANAFFRTHLAGDYEGLGQMLWQTGDLNRGLEVSRNGVQILEQLSQANPSSATLREYLGEAYLDLQPILRQHGDLDASLDDARKALRIFDGLVAKDSTNRLAKNNLFAAELEVGGLLAAKGQLPEGISYVRRVMSAVEAIEPKSRYEISSQARSYSVMGEICSRLADRDPSIDKKMAQLREARTWYQRSLRTWQLDPHHGSPDPSGNSESVRVAAELSKCESALAELSAHPK
jgi:non-specific serine/threonine protein kinase/serine/threonine-protein kinase